MEKHSAQFPDDRGRFGNEPCSSDVAVLLIGTRSNHPMGMLAPGFKDVGAHMAGMVKNLKGGLRDSCASFCEPDKLTGACRERG